MILHLSSLEFLGDKIVWCARLKAFVDIVSFVTPLDLIDFDPLLSCDFDAKAHQVFH
jgi:hypothetical protein